MIMVVIGMVVCVVRVVSQGGGTANEMAVGAIMSGWWLVGGGAGDGAPPGYSLGQEPHTRQVLSLIPSFPSHPRL